MDFAARLYAFWTAFHPAAYAARFDLLAPWTLENFERVWNAAPFARYFLNTFLLVTLILACQLVICTLAAYAFTAFPFRGSNVLFMVVLLQLMIMPEVLLVENYRTLGRIGLARHDPRHRACPIWPRPSESSCCGRPSRAFRRSWRKRPASKAPNALQILLRVFVPVAKPTYIAYGLVTVSFHWNNFLWPLVVTNSVDTRPITVGLQVFSTVEQGVDWSLVTAATLLSVAPLLARVPGVPAAVRPELHARRHPLRQATRTINADRSCIRLPRLR